MAPPPRRPSRTRARSSSRLASLLFGIGCLVVLGVTFALGVAAGRRWPHGLPGFTASADVTAATSKERDRKSEGQGLAKTIAEAPPVLTFYRELTAPLVSPPPTPRAAAKPEAKPKDTEAKPKETAKPRPVETVKPTAPAPSEGAEGRFTVQVGAFKARSQADALRARLAAGGQPSYVSEVEADGAMQYRVRVGSFTTREAAREAATRLAGERQLATYVTTR
jgi:cell division protein FtsN